MGDCGWSTPRLVPFTPLKVPRYQSYWSLVGPQCRCERVLRREKFLSPTGFRTPACNESVYQLHNLGSQVQTRLQIGKGINHADNFDVNNVKCETFRELCYMSIWRLQHKVSDYLPPLPRPRPLPPRFELILGVKSGRVSLETGAVQMKYVG